MKRRGTSRFSFVGYIFFFIFVAVIITCAVLIYSYIADKVSGDGAIAAIMLAVVFLLTALYTAIDYIRRKIMVDAPVNKILDATDKIAKGDFNVSLTPDHTYSRYNAYDLVMENINKMAAELSRNEVLKTDFISNVSHEIKTPLAVISNYAALLQDESLSPEERGEYAEALLSATRRLTDLTANILKLNKLENQVITEKKVLLNVGDLLGEAVLGFEEAIDKKNISLSCDIDDIASLADRTFLEIIFNNIISNAVKFTDENGNISVSLKEKNGEISFSVRDDGIGMDKATGERIFDKFYQGDTSHAAEGNGLGLALVKKVVGVMGGEISVESEKKKGSLFVVSWRKQQ